MTEQEIQPDVEPDRKVRVFFDLPKDEDGYPYVGAESMWARPYMEPDLFVLHNIPFFVRGVAEGNTIRVAADDTGKLWATEQVAWSGNCTIRVFPLPALTGGLQAVVDAFAPLDVGAEGSGQFGVVALNVPQAADLREVRRLLHQGSDEGWWDYEEACVGDDWKAADPR